MTVKVWHLISGEEVVGKVGKETSDSITVEKPAAIHVGADAQNQMQLALAPMLPLSAEKEMVLNKSVVAYTFVPVEELVNNYNQAFGNGLITKTNQLLT